MRGEQIRNRIPMQIAEKHEKHRKSTGPNAEGKATTKKNTKKHEKNAKKNA
jgi:hypothetical protein